MLFHVSEEPDIARFEPRPSEFTDEPVVWAIDDERLRNYLLPRDCPRVTYYAGKKTTTADRERLLGSNRAVVAVEERWLDRLRAGRVFCYHLPPQTFACLDEGAGYFVSPAAVVPARVEVVDDLMSEPGRRGVGVRVVANLWPLRDIVAASSVEFSMIRMRNALPRPSQAS